jgi:hypothetical protein
MIRTLLLALLLTAPAVADLQHTGSNAASAQRVWGRMPASIRKLQVTALEAQPRTPQWKFVGSGYVARVDVARHLIVYREYSPGTMVHELFHIVYWRLTPEQRAVVQAEFADHPQRSPTDYGRKNVWEFFAELGRGVYAPGSEREWSAREHWEPVLRGWIE